MTLAPALVRRTQHSGNAFKHVALCRSRFHSSSISAKAAVVEWGYGKQSTRVFDMDGVVAQGPNRTRIAAGASHWMMSLPGPEMTLAWGTNHSGQLGLGSRDERTTFNPIGASDMDVLALGCGREHSMVLVKDRPQRCGNDSSAPGSPLDKNHLLGFGNSMYGQLGLGRSKDTLDEELAGQENVGFVFEPSPRPVRLPDPSENITQVECGLDHTVLLTDQGNLYSMGWGADGQLGLGPDSSSDRALPTLIERLSWSAKGKEIGRVKEISCSTDFTLALLENHQLWIWGNAEYGQCMVNKKIDRILEPMRIPHPIPDSETIASVAAGGTFGLLLTKSGMVYTCGYGALGLGRETTHILMPEQIKSLSGIRKIVASTDYAAAIDDNGHLYTWGTCGKTGRLGHGEFEHCFEPRRVQLPQEGDGRKVVVHDVALGLNGALALLEYDEK